MGISFFFIQKNNYAVLEDKNQNFKNKTQILVPGIEINTYVRRVYKKELPRTSWDF